MEAAVKYNLALRDDSGTARKPNAKPVTEMTPAAQWQTVKAKPKKNLDSAQPQKPQTGTAQQASGIKWELDQQEGSQPVLKSFQLGLPGIYLEESLTEAEKHAQRLCGSKHCVALLTVRPLSLQKHLQAVTFKLKNPQAAGGERQRVVHGYLNSFGPDPVQHLGGVDVIHRRATASPTQVLLGIIRKDYVSAETWQEAQKLDTPAKVKEQLRQLRSDLIVEDTFRLRHESSSIQIMIRVKSSQVTQWPAAKTLPMLSSPIGEQAAAYRIVWDKDLTSTQQAYDKYEHLSGFRGVVATSRGLGARFLAAEYQQARNAAGLPEGELFQISGVPLDMQETEVKHVLTDMQWQAEILAGSRLARGRTAVFKVRASQSPAEAGHHPSHDRQ